MNHQKTKTQPAHKKKNNTHNTTWTVVNRSVSPIATRLRTKLRYGDYYSLGNVAGFKNIQLNLNSLFDPDRTGVGHQPRGFDQLAAIYGRYRVIAVKVQITYIPSTNVFDTFTVGFLACNGATGPNDIPSLLEQPFSSWHTLGPYVEAKKLTRIFRLAEVNGKTNQAYMSDDTTQALVSASPSELILLNVIAISNSGANNNVYATALLEFEVEFSDPNVLGVS